MRFQRLIIATVAVMTLMLGYTLARSAAGLLHSERRVTFDNTMLMGWYSAAQGGTALLLLHLFPRLAI